MPLELAREETIIIANVAKGIGSIAMDFNAFRYYEPSSSNPPVGIPPVGTDLGAANFAYTMPGDSWTVFSVELTNFDESKKDIILYSTSCIWLLSPPTSAGAVKGDTWYITRVVDHKLAIFTPQVLRYNDPTTVYFGAWYGKSVADSVTAVNILLFGEIDGNDYGQNVPFVSIYID